MDWEPAHVQGTLFAHACQQNLISLQRYGKHQLACKTSLDTSLNVDMFSNHMRHVSQMEDV